MPYFQIAPDWRHNYASPEAIEKDLIGFKYRGDGVYDSDTDTIIVQQAHTTYEVSCWNCPYTETILGACLELGLPRWSSDEEVA